MDEESLRERRQRSRRNDWCASWHSGSPAVVTEGNLLLVAVVCVELRTGGCINHWKPWPPSDKQQMQTKLAEQSLPCSAELLTCPVNPCYWQGHPQSQIFRFATFTVITPRLQRLCYWSAQSDLQQHSAVLLMPLFGCIGETKVYFFLVIYQIFYFRNPTDLKY